MECIIYGCQNSAEVICNCQNNLFICKVHAEDHCNSDYHSLQSVYIELDDITMKKITTHINSCIKSFEKSISDSMHLADSIIKKIKANCQQALRVLKSQIVNYQILLAKCVQNKIKRNEINSVWNSLNDIGFKNIFSALPEVCKINPVFEFLAITIKETSQNLRESEFKLMAEKYKGDILFKDTVDFLSQINFSSLAKSYETSQKIIEFAQLETFRDMVDKHHSELEKNYEVGSGSLIKLDAFCAQVHREDLSKFFSQEILITILKAIDSSTQLIDINKEPPIWRTAESLLDIINHIQITGSLNNYQILKTFQSKLDYQGHFSIIKQFYLLGKGEYFYRFIELTSQETSNAENVFKDLLNYYKFESANYIQNISFTHNTEINEYSLIYNIPYPLNLFLTEKLMSHLNQIFNLLFNLRKIEFELKSNSYKTFCSDYEVEMSYLHKYFILKHRLVLLINFILDFLMCQVIENNWIKFQKKIKSAGSLEDVSVELCSLVSGIYKYVSQDKPFISYITMIISHMNSFIKIKPEIESVGQSTSKDSVRKNVLNRLLIVSENLNENLCKFLGSIGLLDSQELSIFKMKAKELVLEL